MGSKPQYTYTVVSGGKSRFSVARTAMLAASCPRQCDSAWAFHASGTHDSTSAPITSLRRADSAATRSAHATVSQGITLICICGSCGWA